MSHCFQRENTKSSQDFDQTCERTTSTNQKGKKIESRFSKLSRSNRSKSKSVLSSLGILSKNSSQ